MFMIKYLILFFSALLFSLKPLVGKGLTTATKSYFGFIAEKVSRCTYFKSVE